MRWCGWVPLVLAGMLATVTVLATAGNSDRGISARSAVRSANERI